MLVRADTKRGAGFRLFKNYKFRISTSQLKYKQHINKKQSSICSMF
jgi:hypothetical protein